MSFDIDAESFPVKAHVIEGLAFDVIIGRDFLREFCSRIDFVDNIVEFVHTDVPLPFDLSRLGDDPNVDGSEFVSSVHADFSVTIPPRCEKIVLGKLKDMPVSGDICCIVIPRSHLPHCYSIFGAAEIVKVSEDGTVPIRIVNPSAQLVKIFHKTRLGDFSSVGNEVETFELHESPQEISSAMSEDQIKNKLPHRDYSDLPNLSDSILNDDDRIKFRELFRFYRDVFAFANDQLGKTSLVQHVIDTGDAMPIKQRPYRTTPQCRQEIDHQVKDMLQKGVIRESISPWSSPVVLVKKKNGSFRFCVDLRKVNAVTRKDSFPMPLVSDTLDALSGTKYFSTLDLKSGYWQIEMHPESREKTAFVTHNGLYEFNVMPFGLTNSGTSFQRLMGHILRGLEYRFALIYIDDIIIFSKSIDKHLTHLEEVFRRLHDGNVKLNPEKCSFVKQRIEYLGHVVTPEGIFPDPS